MNLQPYSEQITVQQEFIWQTAGLVHKVGNVTLSGAAFEGTVKAGTVIVQGADGLSIPYDGATFVAADGQVLVTTNDIIVGTQNVQVGALEEAYLNKNKITGYHADLEADSGFRFKVRG